MAAQGLHPELRQLLLHGVLLQDVPEPAGAAAGGASGPAARAAAGAAAQQQAQQQQAQQAQQQQQQPVVAEQALEGASAAAAELPPLSAAAALRLLRLYTQSSGRYGPGTGPFLTPMYGCGELPQAFCRVAAVAGAVQVLRCGVDGLSFDEHTYACVGVKLASGQVRLRCCGLSPAPHPALDPGGGWDEWEGWRS